VCRANTGGGWSGHGGARPARSVWPCRAGREGKPGPCAPKVTRKFFSAGPEKAGGGGSGWSSCKTDEGKGAVGGLPSTGGNGRTTAGGACPRGGRTQGWRQGSGKGGKLPRRGRRGGEGGGQARRRARTHGFPKRWNHRWGLRGRPGGGGRQKGPCLAPKRGHHGTIWGPDKGGNARRPRAAHRKAWGPPGARRERIKRKFIATPPAEKPGPGAGGQGRPTSSPSPRGVPEGQLPQNLGTRGPTGPVPPQADLVWIWGCFGPGWFGRAFLKENPAPGLWGRHHESGGAAKQSRKLWRCGPAAGVSRKSFQLLRGPGRDCRGVKLGRAERELDLRHPGRARAPRAPHAERPSE